MANNDSIDKIEVLLVDPSELQRDGLKRLLETADKRYQVYTASTPHEAYTAAKEHPEIKEAYIYTNPCNIERTGSIVADMINAVLPDIGMVAHSVYEEKVIRPHWAQSLRIREYDCIFKQTNMIGLEFLRERANILAGK